MKSKNEREPNLHISIKYQDGAVQSVKLSSSENLGLHWSFQSDIKDNNLENCIVKWLEEYRQKKKPTVQIPFALNHLPLFTRKVLGAISKIPFGAILTYGEIAAMVGNPNAARAVGGACGRNPIILFIPCHRVLDSKRELRGFSCGGLSIKKSLLIFEEESPNCKGLRESGEN